MTWMPIVRRNMIRVTLRCKECGQPQQIWRQAAKCRTAWHTKHLWCIRCAERTAHIQEPLNLDSSVAALERDEAIPPQYSISEGG